MKLVAGEPAALVEAGGRKNLVIGDLHIGFEEDFLAEGYRLQPSTTVLEEKLKKVLRRYKPSRLVLLGDVKHSVAGISRSEWRLVPPFIERISNLVPVVLLQGNHDGGIERLLPRKVQLIKRKWTVLHEVGLTHGHIKAPKAFQEVTKIIMGHLHPIIRSSGGKVPEPVSLVLTVRRKALFGGSSRRLLEILVLPPFNPEICLMPHGGLKRRPISPIIKAVREQVVEARVLSLQGEVLGGLELLSQII